MKEFEVIFVFFLFFIAFLLLMNMANFIKIKHEISEYNKKAIECCMLLECDVSPFGDLSCYTLTSAVEEFNDSDLIILNISIGDLNKS